MSNAVRRIRTFYSTDHIGLDNQVNDFLEYLAKYGGSVLDVKTTAVQAGTLLTHIATVFYTPAV